MGSLDLNLLRVLEALFDHGSVSKAAVSLGVSQPSASQSLRRLRDYFGDELFVRHGNTMLPTTVAETLREPLTRSMDVIRQQIVQAAPFAAATADRQFSVHLSDLGDLTFLPDLMRELKQEAPFSSIRSVAAEPNQLLAGLADGSIDIALGHLTDLDTHSCFEQTLFEQDFVCLVRTDHPTIRGSLTLEQYLLAEHAVVVQEGRSQQVFERRISELGLRRRIALHSPHFMSVPFLVAHSDMITVLPLAVGRVHARSLHLQLLPVPFPTPPVELKQFWHRRAHADPANIWLRKLIARLFVGHDPTLSATSQFWSTLPEP